MGSVPSSDSISVNQLHVILEDLKAKDAQVTIHVSAFHYEQYTETTIENEEIPPEERPFSRGQATAAPAPPRFPQKVRTEVKQRKVETLKEVRSLGGLVKKQVNLVKEKQKKDRAGGKKHFQPLPRLDHKHNKWLARDADVYNLHQPVLAQV